MKIYTTIISDAILFACLTSSLAFFEKYVFRLSSVLEIAFYLYSPLIIHELGHALPAKALHCKVDKIVFGAGKSILSFKVGEMLFDVKLIPISVTLFFDHNRYMTLSPLQKIYVILGGLAMSFAYGALLIGAGQSFEMQNLIDTGFVSLFIGVFNSIPVAGLDGRKIVLAIKDYISANSRF